MLDRSIIIFPKIAVLTNIDKEHLDIYKNLNGVLAGFKSI